MTEPEFSPDTDERDLEAPEADAVEQTIPVEPDIADEPVHRGLEVDEGDAVEQARVVNNQDDDYR